jgi:hypothetical protein
LVGLLALLVPALSAYGWERAPSPRADEIADTLFLIGDGGKPAEGEEPVLVALARDLRRDPARTAVVFLGDNVYEQGLLPPDHPDRAETERRLDQQVDAVSGTGAQVLFLPGNHDWDKGGADGWNAVRRQQERVLARGGRNVRYLPKEGCPGPEVMDVGERLRLVALDTQWFLHEYEKPVHPTSTCAADSEEEVVARLRSVLAEAGSREVVIVSHHPLETGGPHGGHFTVKDHLFPLTNKVKWLWLPLPLIGSAYPIARQSGITSQDLSSAAYQRMREVLVEAARERPPLAWAAGHEHTLQVIESPEWGRVLVSGTGIYGHVSPVREVPGSRYRASQAGYLRLDLLRDGRRFLTALEVRKTGETKVAFAGWLK